MFNQFGEQFKNALQPFNALVAANAKTVETLASQQTALFTTVLNDNVAFAQSLESQKDINDVVEAQKAYAEQFQQRLTDSAQESYAVISQSNEKIADVLKGVFNK